MPIDKLSYGDLIYPGFKVNKCPMGYIPIKGNVHDFGLVIGDLVETGGPRRLHCCGAYPDTCSKMKNCNCD